MLNTVNAVSLVLTLAAVIAMFRFKIGMIPVLAACSAAGVLYYLTTGSVG
jgi:chromate transporter